MKLLTKACPRCHGDLGRVDDLGDVYFSCVQCGHVAYGLDRPQAQPALRAASEAEPLRAA